MPKSFDSDALISSSDLHELGNRRLEEMLSTFKKLGVMHNNRLRAVILDIRTYEELMNRLEELEDMLEDLQLSRELGQRVRISAAGWLEKPDSRTRLEFLEQLAKDPGADA